MAHSPVQPTGTTVSLNLSENVEIYACPVGNTLTSGDLIANTTGDLDVAPTTQITRVALHNGRDFVSPGARQSAPFTIQVFLPSSDSKMQELLDSYNNKSFMKFNIFNRDGTGYAGFWIVTRIKPTTDPSANEWSQAVTVEPFDVEVLEPA